MAAPRVTLDVPPLGGPRVVPAPRGDAGFAAARAWTLPVTGRVEATGVHWGEVPAGAWNLTLSPSLRARVTLTLQSGSLVA